MAGRKHKYKTPFADLLPPLTGDERTALAADIKKNGVLNPCLIDEEDNILDGHNRLAIDPQARVIVISGLSLAEKKAFVLCTGDKHRNQSPEQKAATREQKRLVAFEMREEDHKKWTQQRVASQLGVPRETVRDWFSNGESAKAKPDSRVSVPKSLRPEMVDRVDSGESVSQVAADFGITKGRVSQIVTQERKRAENKAKVEAITEQATAGTFDGLYDVIVIDPPWPMKKIERDVRPNQSVLDYPTMDEEELSAMVMPSSSDCHLWLWTTHKFLPMAYRLLSAWGFRYVCAFVWHKPGGFQPIGLPQYNCEFALYARKGSPEFSETTSFNTCFEAPRGEHSEKPEEFYEVVRRVTTGRRIDIFNRRPIEGFDGWGNQS